MSTTGRAAFIEIPAEIDPLIDCSYALRLHFPNSLSLNFYVCAVIKN